MSAANSPGYMKAYMRFYHKRPEVKLARRLRDLANKAKTAARHAVNNAIRDGRLKRGRCEVCGKRAEAHHVDYSKPLEVRWLCRRHHLNEHRILPTL